MAHSRTIRTKLSKLLFFAYLLLSLVSFLPASTFADPATSCPTGYADNGKGTCVTQAYQPSTVYHCGGGGSNDSIATSIDIGCKGMGNPIADFTFAIIRFLSDGVGLVVIGSIIYGGIQYTASRGDPQATALAIGRIRSSLFALLIFIFGYAILNYVIPAGFLQ